MAATTTTNKPTTQAAPVATQAAPAAPVATAPAAPRTAPAAPTRYVALVLPHNPKKPGSASAARFALYTHGCTVAAYAQAVVAAGQPMRKAAEDIRWDVKHGFITLHTTAALCGAAPKAPAPKA